MADKETEEKTKQTVPPLVRSAKGIADHAAAVLEMQWDKERRAFRDPFTVMMALFSYTKLTATVLHEFEEQLAQANKKRDERIAAVEARLTTIEMKIAQAEQQGAEMAKGLEEMMSGGGPDLDQFRALLAGGKEELALPPAAAPPPENGSVVPLKPEKPNKKTEEKRERAEKRDESKGGAA